MKMLSRELLILIVVPIASLKHSQILFIICSRLLRIIYSESTKEELMDNDEILESFFTTADHGKNVLANYSELKWDLILEDTF